MRTRRDPAQQELELRRAALATGALVLLLGAAVTAGASAWADVCFFADAAAAPWPCAPEWPSLRAMGPFLGVAAVIVGGTLLTQGFRREPALRVQVLGLATVATAVFVAQLFAPRNPLSAFVLLGATIGVGASLAWAVVYRSRPG